METREVDFLGTKFPGIPMLLFNILLLIGIILLFRYGITAATLSESMSEFLIVSSVVLFLFNTFAWGGFIRLEPNEARVMLFFGEYRGTVKENGFFWINPFYSRKQLTLRARNLDAEPIKVNDKSGNPIMIGMVVVWRVVDTYKASFDIDNNAMSSSTTSVNVTSTNISLANKDNVNEKMKAYEHFVRIQSDAALRNVAGMYPYDHLNNNESAGSKLSLRSGGEEMNEILESQINERLQIAGIEVVEARINYIAYAPEIAAIMLRRQQADAIISAREKIVEGAVGMVKLALHKLSDEGILELDDDKKAAMAGNLLVVLCGEEKAQPIINSGTLYH